jgi:cytochrome c oxidase assembly protein subunit 11
MLTPAKQRRMALTAALVAGAVVGMVGLSFAAVPLYRAFCSATGYGGTTRVAASASTRALGRPIEVRFDANVAQDLPVEFAPAQRAQQLRLGQTGVAFFKLRNVSSRPVTAVASYNVTPHKAGAFFNKLECFCFQPRVFAPGEEAELAVMFYVDPALADDPDTEEVEAVTLSYTYFADADAAAAALGPGS